MDNFQELVMKLADIKRELKLYKGQETKYINDIKKELDKRGLSKFETDHNTGILSQYYTYYDSIACIQSIVGDNTDLCNLILTPANNE